MSIVKRLLEPDNMMQAYSNTWVQCDENQPIYLALMGHSIDKWLEKSAERR